VKRAPFLVADMETVPDKSGLQIPYAIGLLLVDSLATNRVLDKDSVSWWFSEDFFMVPEFPNRSSNKYYELLP
jgi:hypothetical protein